MLRTMHSGFNHKIKIKNVEKIGFEWLLNSDRIH